MATAGSLLVIVLLGLLSVYVAGAADPEVNDQKTWCVAKPDAEEEVLLSNIKYACRFVDCRVIAWNGRCFLPNRIRSHASVVMNAYYRMYGGNLWNCDFAGSGLITFVDPSYGQCVYD